MCSFIDLGSTRWSIVYWWK